VRLTFLEFPAFTRRLLDLADDEALRALQNELMKSPEQGDIMRGGAGLRKMRMGLASRGKSGGARVIYLYMKDLQTIILVTLYTKADQTSLSAKETAVLAAIIEKTKKELHP
jgi:hypothetical protein